MGTEADASRKGPFLLGGKLLITPWGVLAGLLFGLGVAILLQQYEVAPFTTGSLVLWLGIGLVVGIGVPSIAYAVGASRHKQ